MKRAVCTVVSCLALSASAHAAYVLTPLCEGGSTATVALGSSLTLELFLTSTAGDTHNSAIFDLVFTQPGLRYDAYAWSAPYLNALPNDDSTPLFTALPVLLAEDTLTGTGHPAGLVDIELSNVLIGSTFGAGQLVSLTFTVPEDYGYLGWVYIAVAPETFANGFNEIPTSAGQVFALQVVPEPMTCIGLALAALLRRAR